VVQDDPRPAILGVPLSITGFIGRTLRGRVDAPIRCRSFAEFERLCGGLWAQSELGFAVYHFFQNGGYEALIARVATGATTAAVALRSSGAPLRLESADPGAWGNSLRVSVSGEDAECFDLDVELLDAPGGIASSERFERVHVADLARVLAAESALVRVATTSTERPFNQRDASLAGGDDGGFGSVDDYQDALWLLKWSDAELMVIPPHGETVDIDVEVLHHGQLVCGQTPKLLLVDPPLSWSNYADAARLEGFAPDFDPEWSVLRDDQTAVYYPRVVAPDPLNTDRLRSFGPSGFVAGMIARFERERGAWTAPDGPDARLIGVVGLTDTLGEAERQALGLDGVNALTLDSTGAVWVRSSLACDRTSKYSDKRLWAFLAANVHELTRWAEFEPVDEALLAKLREAVTPFLDESFRRGAWRGETASEAYSVRVLSDPTWVNVRMLVGVATVEPGRLHEISIGVPAGRKV
jgi:uncharacterized protein